ncbi:MAG: hypothetical protein ACXWIN_07595 [Burkholderiaceae bacterium]
MIDNTPPVIPKEPASWKGTILSLAVHALIFGAIWVAMRHGTGNQPAKVDSQSGTQSQATAPATPIAASAIPPEIKPVVKDSKVDTPVTDAASTPNKNEMASTTTEAATKPMPQQALIPEPETKHASQKLLAASIENKKAIEEKKKKHKNELAMAKLAEKQKSEALAQKIKQKKKTEEAELLAKKRANEVAIKVAAESQKRKELEDQRALEKSHQEEMQRIKNGLAGNG